MAIVGVLDMSFGEPNEINLPGIGRTPGSVMPFMHSKITLKQQIDFRIRPEGRSLGLHAQDVAKQVRHAYYGAEALRQQRGRSEVKVMVRMPKSDRGAIIFFTFRPHRPCTKPLPGTCTPKTSPRTMGDGNGLWWRSLSATTWIRPGN